MPADRHGRIFGRRRYEEAVRHGGSAVRSMSATFTGAAHAGGSDDATARAFGAANPTDAAGAEPDGVAGTVGETIGGVGGDLCNVSRPRAGQYAPYSSVRTRGESGGGGGTGKGAEDDPIPE